MSAVADVDLRGHRLFLWGQHVLFVLQRGLEFCVSVLTLMAETVSTPPSETLGDPCKSNNSLSLFPVSAAALSALSCLIPPLSNSKSL